MTTTTPEFTSLREKIAWEKRQREERYAAFERLFAEADAAGRRAGEAATPTPIIVGSPSTPLGTDVDPSKPTYYVPEGVCGFGWVKVNPGSSSFARWLVKTGRGSTSYPKGVQIWIRGYGQSYERKVAHARAMADVLTSSPLLAGQRIYAGGRLD